MVTGPPLESIVISISEGWNLISGISFPVDVNAILDSDGLIVPGTIYGFAPNYFNAETIESGNGYWLRSNGDGEIIISNSAQSIRKMKFQSPKEINTITLNNTLLYFGGDFRQNNLLSYSLPPKPPVGATDIRFSDDTKLCIETECVIDIETDNKPLIIKFNIKENSLWELSDKNGNVFLLENTLDIEIGGDTKQLILKDISEYHPPSDFSLFSAYPNPFNPITTISYDLPRDAFVNLTIYNMLGKEIMQLVNTAQEAGPKSVQWDATDSITRAVSAGVYFYKIQAGDFVQTKKMVLLK